MSFTQSGSSSTANIGIYNDVEGSQTNIQGDVNGRYFNFNIPGTWTNDCHLTQHKKITTLIKIQMDIKHLYTVWLNIQNAGEYMD